MAAFVKEFVEKIPKLCCQVNPYVLCRGCGWTLCELDRFDKEREFQEVYVLHLHESPECRDSRNIFFVP